MSDFYKLNDDHSTEPCSMEEFGHLMQNLRENDRKHVVKETYLGHFISTVFLGLNHNFDGSGSPLLFETMIFHPDSKWNELYADRYSTWEEAKEGHELAKKWLKQHLNDEVSKVKEPE